MITPSTIYWITRFDDIRMGLAVYDLAVEWLEELRPAGKGEAK